MCFEPLPMKPHVRTNCRHRCWCHYFVFFYLQKSIVNGSMTNSFFLIRMSFPCSSLLKPGQIGAKSMAYHRPTAMFVTTWSRSARSPPQRHGGQHQVQSQRRHLALRRPPPPHGSLLLPRSVPHHAQRQVFQEVPTNFADETDKVQKAAKPPCKSDTTGPSGAPHTSHLRPFQTNERVCGRLAQSIFAAAFMRPLLEATARLLHSFAKWHFPCPL